MESSPSYLASDTKHGLDEMDSVYGGVDCGLFKALEVLGGYTRLRIR